MYRNEREREILKLLSSESYLTVKQISEQLYTSESSIRRDLISLEKQGAITRSYGGAELVKNSSQIIPFSARAHYNVSAKRAMARKASQLIQDGDIVFLDQSSSAFFVTYELLKKSKITVVTNNIEIIAFLSQSDIEVVSAGGLLSKSNRNCLIGNDAQRFFSEIHADILFFSSKALAWDGTIYDCNREEICIRKVMMDNAEKKVFLCDSEKFGKFSGYKQCTLKDINYLVTETSDFEKINRIKAASEVIYS